MIQATTIQTAFVIDDNEVDLFIQKRFMELNRFADEVVTFNSPSQAMEVIQNQADQPPQVIFLDLNMPALSGFDLLESLKKSLPDIANKFKFVILTSSNSQADYDRAQSFENVVGFITKPLTVQRLKELQSKITKD